ncbi:MAG TPA: FecR family protein [Chitinophaga sp.]|uniref:FecR family protein n=1 Tax=Chitinophaga sp. TaxID=1869181 RepID=UPI002D1A251E|nr:FecR family protein [Chitinophaga sp.]HVI44387.1 FecR family protein [Chitinophaga sp.]
MERFAILIQKIKDGVATPEDIAMLEAMLEQEEDSQFRQTLREAFDNAIATGEQVLPPERTNAILSQMHEKIQAREEPITQVPVRQLHPRWLQLLAAAAVVLLISISAIVYNQLLNRNPVPVVTALHTKVVRNGSGKTVTITLPESSRVSLDPGSSLSYKGDTDSAVRHVTLQGKARFFVNADHNRPFVVYSGNVTTTALGTVFTVNAAIAGKVSVTLESGKVLLSARDGSLPGNLYLLPGEECHINNITHQYAVNSIQADNTVPRTHTPVKRNILLEFNNLPLDSVFSQLENIFNTKIHYEYEDISEAYFTGQVLSTDTLRNILLTICQLNNLELTEDGEGIKLRKKR